MDAGEQPYYRAALAAVHDRGFGGHADACAPGVLDLLAPLRHGRGAAEPTVLELGCGSGRLTRHLLDAGHRVIATDASPAMLALCRAAAPEAEIRRLTLPGDPLPAADAIVSVGHTLNYLPDEAAVERALGAIARALRPGGLLVLDLCDLRFGELRRGQPPLARVEDGWAIVTRYALPEPARFVREITVFVRRPDGCWRRDDERHVNVLVDTVDVPALLAAHGVEARVERVLGTHVLPDGLLTVAGRKRDQPPSPGSGTGTAP